MVAVHSHSVHAAVAADIHGMEFVVLVVEAVAGPAVLVLEDLELVAKFE